MSRIVAAAFCALLLAAMPAAAAGAKPPENGPAAIAALGANPPLCYFIGAEGAIADGAVTQTGLAIHFAADGTITEATVTRPSGSTALDAAAIACAVGEKMDQVSGTDGAPIDGTWSFVVYWQKGSGTSIGLDMTEARGGCDAFLPESDKSRETAKVTVRFRIAADGSVHDAEVTRSSGYRSMDAGFRACTPTWRYPPVLRGGVPVEAVWSAELVHIKF